MTSPPIVGDPVIAPAGLMLAGKVKIDPGPLNVVKVPSSERRKPCCTVLASK
jgi:hypothetical protein